MKKISNYFIIGILGVFLGLFFIHSATVNAADVSVRYNTHVQFKGWTPFVSDGVMSGTEGESLRLEGLAIEVLGNENLGIRYSTHVQNVGWQEYRSNGAQSGTTGRGLRVEAVKIELTGADEKEYDVYYRVHAQNYGWLGWAKNGFASGTEGYGYRLEAIQVMVVKKDQLGPDTSAVSFHSKNGSSLIAYKAHVESVGWQAEVKDGALSGLVGQSKRMEAVTAELGSLLPSGSVTYQAHVQNKGWMSEVSNGQLAGTEGLGLRVEAFKFWLEGKVADAYGIEYRTHVQNKGWMPWKKDGEISGTTGESLRVEAIEIRLYEKPQDFINQKDHAIYTIIVDSLNLRQEPNVGSARVAVMPRGSKVKVYEIVNGWARLEFNGKTGYANASTSYMRYEYDVFKEPIPMVLELGGAKDIYQKEDVLVTGTTLAYAGVYDVKAYLDGKEVYVSRYNDAEASSIYTKYPNKNLAFYKIELPHGSISAGDHTLMVQMESNYRNIASKSVKFKMVKNDPILTVEGIKSGDPVPAEATEVKGVALSDSGIKEVRYHVNGSFRGNAAIGLPSNGSNYPDYPNANTAGYSFVLEKEVLSKDMNTLKVELVSNDGTIEYRNIIVKGNGPDTLIMENYPSTFTSYVDKEYINAQKYVGSGTAVWQKIRDNMDPGNFIYDDINRFIFMDLSYSEEYFEVSVEQLNAMLSGRGVLSGMGQAFLDAGIQYKVNPFYLIAHSLLETGNGGSVLANGQTVEVIYSKFGDINSPSTPVPQEDLGKLVYNVFGIGAWDVNPNLWGAQKAYSEKWFSVEEAIMGGAKWISTNYIHRANPQNTLYKMRFNLGENMTHQYATDIEWARKQASRIKSQFDSLGVNVPKRYIIPIFK
ncbi:glucosaminidase domain-containing protein [Proteiniclasticum ruminis]|uniref:Beta-N-acetylglucosaminidase n=1 Tax=Proteiniclasticum ruminis TaxID=398199 RepID=A0A1I5A4R5_9CLOT|nr:glucosaminidase domain-containing protein [Proteiniclasticum ruminis]SFN57475.1 Beta-N-acetylglucosaminidase [Proteiniclasticum ruminis]